MISPGLLGKVIVLPMKCRKKNNNFTCESKIERRILPESSYVFWFAVKTEKGYYFVPNKLISHNIFDDIGKIEFK